MAAGRAGGGCGVDNILALSPRHLGTLMEGRAVDGRLRSRVRLVQAAAAVASLVTRQGEPGQRSVLGGGEGEEGKSRPCTAPLPTAAAGL